MARGHASKALLACVFAAAAKVTIRAAAEYAVAAGLDARAGSLADRGQPQPQQFANRRRTGRHPVPEPEIVDNRKLFRRQHDLQSLAPEIIHDGPQIRLRWFEQDE